MAATACSQIAASVPRTQFRSASRKWGDCSCWTGRNRPGVVFVVAFGQPAEVERGRAELLHCAADAYDLILRLRRAAFAPDAAHPLPIAAAGRGRGGDHAVASCRRFLSARSDHRRLFRKSGCRGPHCRAAAAAADRERAVHRGRGVPVIDIADDAVWHSCFGL